MTCLASYDTIPAGLAARRPSVIDADAVIRRLEEAGRVLLALPDTGPSTRLVQSGMGWVRDAAEAGSAMATDKRVKLRPAIPSAEDITRMDEALAWIPLIPIDRHVLRRVVGARCLVSPMTGRHLYTWRRLGVAVGADHKAVQRWHAQGIDRIVASLTSRSLKRPQDAARCSGADRGAGVAQAARHDGGAQP